jgi:hypothetical protein
MIRKAIPLLFILAVTSPVTFAEPFLAVETGYHCKQCHINPAGGGLRNRFGALFSTSLLPASAAAAAPSPGSLGEHLTVGIDARGSALQRENTARDDHLSFATDRVTVYLAGKLTEDVTLYVDQQFAPGGSLNREFWAQYTFGNTYLRAGKIFIPYGWRLEDDSVVVRQITNVNFNSADNGIELGHVGDHLSAQVSVTNGSGGGFESDDGKMISGRLAWMTSAWRVGISANDNNTDGTDRRMAGLFAGLKTGPVSWLFEFDRIRDDRRGLVDVDQELTLLEANWKLSQGHYLKITGERRTASPMTPAAPDSERYSVEYQWFPMPYTHLRLGFHSNQSDDPNPARNEDEAFLQLHVYF